LILPSFDALKKIALNVKEKVAEHLKGISPDALKDHFNAEKGIGVKNMMNASRPIVH
jgi:hypothetical protein